MLRRRPKLAIETERMTLRLPLHEDYRHWAGLREASAAFLQPWEPAWSSDHLTRKSFSARVYWAQRASSEESALPLFLIRREDQRLLGAVTLDNIRRGPAQAGTIGYWIGQPYARNGYMREAVVALIHYAFTRLDLSRIESACLPETPPPVVFWRNAAINMRGSRKAICRSMGAGAIMCFTPICAVTAVAAPKWAKALWV